MTVNKKKIKDKKSMDKSLFSSSNLKKVFSSYKKNKEQKKLKAIKLKKLSEINQINKEKRELRLWEDRLGK